MQPWELLDTADVPGGGAPMTLHRRGTMFSLRVGGVELMNNWIYGMDCGLAAHGGAHLAGHAAPRVLIGGLGMGFTLAATLQRVSAGARVVVAELVPAVVRWNESLLGDLAGRPLDDARVTVEVDDVRSVLRRGGPWDAILLDVDNGPEGLSREGNDALYGRAGLLAARSALRPGGRLAVWSLSGDGAFATRLHDAGFAVDEHRVKGRGGRARQTIFVARPRRAQRPSGSRAAR